MDRYKWIETSGWRHVGRDKWMETSGWRQVDGDTLMRQVDRDKLIETS